MLLQCHEIGIAGQPTASPRRLHGVSGEQAVHEGPHRPG